MILSLYHRLALAALAVAVYLAAVAWLAAQAAPAGCTSSVGPGGEPEVRCTVLWLAQVHGGGL